MGDFLAKLGAAGALPALTLILGYFLQPARDWFSDMRADRRQKHTSQRQTLTALQDALFALDDWFTAVLNETNEDHVKGRTTTRFGVGVESHLERTLRQFSQKVDRLRVLVEDEALRQRIVTYQAALDISKWTHENFKQRDQDRANALTQVNDRLGELLRGLT
jgi:hypothetical protein